MVVIPFVCCDENSLVFCASLYLLKKDLKILLMKYLGIRNLCKLQGILIGSKLRSLRLYMEQRQMSNLSTIVIKY